MGKKRVDFKSQEKTVSDKERENRKSKDKKRKPASGGSSGNGKTG